MKSTFGRALAWMLACLMLLGVQQAWAADAVETRDILNIAVAQQAPSLDLHKNSTLIARQMCSGTVWEKLVTLDANSEPVPELCESYDISEDARTFTFYLRKGVRFHDGSEMTADDVVASMNRWTAGFSSAGSLVGGAQFEKVDDYTVKIECPAPALMLPSVIAGAAQPAAITTAEACAKETDVGYLVDYIGTGPYRFAEWAQDQYVRFERFEDYVPYGDPEQPMDGWAGYKKAYVKTLVYHIVPEEMTRTAGLETGQYDVVFGVSDDNVPRIDANPDLETHREQAGTIAWVFNKKEGIASNPYFRTAVNTAIDCEEALIATYGGAYELGSCYMDSGQPFWYTDVGEDRYNLKDPEKAKAILAENGYAGEPFRILVATLNGMDRMAIVLQSQLEKIGVPVELIIVDWATLTEYRKDPAGFDMYMTTFAGVPVPALKLYFGPAYPGWSEDETLAIQFAKLNEATTMEAAKEAWVELQDYAWDYLPLINGGHYITTYAWSAKLEDANTFSGCYFWNATIAP